MSKIFTIPKQNNIENITQYFGRFFHSPLYFNTQLPYFGIFAFEAVSGDKLNTVEENPDYSNGTTLTTESDTNSRYICIKTEIGDILNLYSPSVTPNYFIDGGDQYRLVPCIQDSSVLIRIYSSTGSTFDTWNPGSGNHPFNDDHIFYVTFYGKRV